MKVMYGLADDIAKILIGMKVRKKVFEYSRAEHLAITFNELMRELERMYRLKQSRIDSRKKFEIHVWTKGESFRKYAHDKIIIGNHVPIDDDDMKDYLIEEIPDRTLSNQARIQCFVTKESLIDAFGKITLWEQQLVKQTQQDKRGRSLIKSIHADCGKGEPNNDKKKMDRKNCFNCGLTGHVSAACEETGP